MVNIKITRNLKMIVKEVTVVRRGIRKDPHLNNALIEVEAETEKSVEEEAGKGEKEGGVTTDGKKIEVETEDITVDIEVEVGKESKIWIF